MQENIDYSRANVDPAQTTGPDVAPKTDLAGRANLHLARRVFHVLNGCTFATIYYFSFSHTQMVQLLGTIACSLYVFEQVRINYPEKARKFLPMTKFVMRAEEQLKESAMVPYLIAILLTIITFPKPIALVAIYTLAIADPLSAIIGIKFGKRRIVPHKSLEGSLAFFIATFSCAFLVLGNFTDSYGFKIFSLSFLISLISSTAEMLPLKLDDNLTIPLSTAFCLWILCFMFGLNF